MCNGCATWHNSCFDVARGHRQCTLLRLERVFKDHTDVLARDDDHSSGGESAGIPSPPTVARTHTDLLFFFLQSPRFWARGVLRFCHFFLPFHLCHFCCWSQNWSLQIIPIFYLSVWSFITSSSRYVKITLPVPLPHLCIWHFSSTPNWILALFIQTRSLGVCLEPVIINFGNGQASRART